ncbi:2-hydroxychromene-2-carboxylate isomerase [Aquabacter sp. L1I39]|uniref:2-hydroxychromene-2-carboxylate isomerase n=1 Tax=Aquabacter sp. L1I39 TaxID=2820278 RepID=UPI001ADC02D5|nr:2-hydroxychromene-2-carboxylate isomerase [Aquabacter sp. L1I39]QTL02236.1 2-hydroxychromene-2-carboxylate isomerase [Aquabacter sp. L1I39]
MPQSVAPIPFWFDFASGYAYFAALEMEAFEARIGRPVQWRPFLLGTAFKVTGVRGLSSTPMKKDYAWRDWARIARKTGVDFQLPAHHPSVALAATRVFYVLEERDAAVARTFAKAVFKAYFTQGIDSGNMEHVVRVADGLGLAGAALAEAAIEPRIKDKVRLFSEEAVASGVFGSPFFFVDGEPFWGWDRLPMMEEWIRTGGW